MKIIHKLMNKIFLLFQKIYQVVSIYISLINFLLYGRYKDCLLLCTPTHGNLGDQAIALAEIEFLRNEGISFFEVTSEQLDNKYDFYSKFSTKKQKILVHGGGFLGDIWVKEEIRFRNILLSFFDKKIIVLPQTISFDCKKNLDFFKPGIFPQDTNSLNITREIPK